MIRSQAAPLPGLSATSFQRRMFVLPALAALLLLPGCTRQDNSQIQQDARQATDQAKAAGKNLKTDAQQGLQKAENAVDAAASGVKEGVNDKVASGDGTTATGRIDLNSASKQQLETLPGVTPAKATAIIANRPYATPDDTVAKHVLTEAQFDRVASQVAAK